MDSWRGAVMFHRGRQLRARKRDHWGDVMQRTASNGIGIALALGLAGASGGTQAGLSCARLTSVTPEASTITSAGIVAPPATIGGAPVAVPFFRGQSGGPPSFGSESKIEVWVPPTA